MLVYKTHNVGLSEPKYPFSIECGGFLPKYPTEFEATLVTTLKDKEAMALLRSYGLSCCPSANGDIYCLGGFRNKLKDLSSIVKDVGTYIMPEFKLATIHKELASVNSNQ